MKIRLRDGAVFTQESGGSQPPIEIVSAYYGVDIDDVEVYCPSDSTTRAIDLLNCKRPRIRNSEIYRAGRECVKLTFNSDLAVDSNDVLLDLAIDNNHFYDWGQAADNVQAVSISAYYTGRGSTADFGSIRNNACVLTGEALYRGQRLVQLHGANDIATFEHLRIDGNTGWKVQSLLQGIGFLGTTCTTEGNVIKSAA